MARQIEETMQMAIVHWLQVRYPEAYAMLHHSPNGGQRGNPRQAAITGAKLKRMGCKAGFPDLAILLPRNGSHGLFVELKADKGRPTASQVEWIENLTNQGYTCSVCTGFDEAKNFIEGYLQGGAS